MNKRDIISIMEEHPIILGMSSEEDFEIIRNNDSKVVFTLFGTVSEIGNTVHALKEIGKTVIVNVDMVDGLSSKNSAVDYIMKTEADGIVSSKSQIIRYAHEQGLFTVHRFFIIDSSSWRSIEKQLEVSRADVINIAPGWTKVIQWTVEKYRMPVIASGLVCDKAIAIDNLKAGAIAICTTNHDVWLS